MDPMNSRMSDEDLTWLDDQVGESIRVQEAVRDQLPNIARIASRMVDVFERGGQLFFFGNGGSAADAQHWAAELSGRFYYDREPLPAVALSTNSSAVTAIANDYGYRQIFARQLNALARPGDMAVGISTSGRSANVIRALEAAKRRDLVTVGFTGQGGGEMQPLLDYWIEVPSADTPRIQEGHELSAHLLCALVERKLFPQDNSES